MKASRSRTLLAAALSLSGLALAGGAVLQPSSAASAPKILLALGDSLAAGYEPSVGSSLPPIDSASGFRDLGYPGSYPADIAAARGLKLMDLGCPGETTSSMTSTPAQKQCVTVYSEEFGARTQVAAALSFLSRHKGQVSDVTIDIGANDLDNCISGTNVNTSCLEQHLGAATTNIGAIVRELQSALRQSDPQARMIAMNYYDPFLGLAFSPGGSHGAQLASASLAATLLFNGELATTYGNFHVPLANVAAAFRIDALNPVTPFDGKKFPANVATNCQLTWMCPTTTAHGPDIHPDLAGYRAIAGAFEKLLAS